jgi:LacI family transcriptional regulator
MSATDIRGAGTGSVFHPSVHDVAALAGVSTGTVSNCFNHPEKVARQSRERVAVAIAKLDFVRNDAASQLKRGTSHTIALLIPDIGNPFFMAVAHGALQRAEESDLGLVIANSDGDAAREARYLSSFARQRSRGVLFAPTGGLSGGEESRLLQLTPFVYIGRPPSDRTARWVGVDDVEGGRIATAHLASRGARRVVFLSGPLTATQVRRRLEGARSEAASDPRIALSVMQLDAQTIPEGRRAGDAISRMSPSTRPDAIFAANDLLAIGLIQELNSGAVPLVPESIMVVGYDDVPTDDYGIRLSTIRQPASDLGRQAVDLLLAHRTGAAGQVVFQPELVIRQSSRATVRESSLGTAAS